MKQLTLLIVFAICTILPAQNITVDSEIYSPQELVENILINSGCIENVAVTNFVSGNFGGTQKSFGYFTANGSSFPFLNGLVMSTGKLSHVPGPNNTLSDDDAANWSGDSDLEQILNIDDTVNATIIEFDFTPNADKIRFRYIFASEEYQEANANTCQYSDVFAFLIKPIGGQYTNIAVVPGTNVPVKVTSVHPRIPGGCEAENEAYFDSFNGSSAPINFNGQTIALSAESTVVPGQTYHIKLVIADDQNYRYDSAVFLEGDSFNIGADLGNDLVGSQALCEGDTYLLQVAGTVNDPIGYKWFKNGTEIPDETSDTFLVTEAGVYRVEVDYGNGCTAVDEILVQYADFGGIHEQFVGSCDGNDDGISNFDLTEVESDILQSGSAFQIEAYFLDENMTEEILNPGNFQNSLPGQTVFVKVSGLGDCFVIIPVQLVTTQTPAIDSESSQQFFCKESGAESIILDSGLIGNENEYEFLWNTGQTTPQIEISEPGEYSVEITKTEIIDGLSFSCSATNTIHVSISERAEISVIVLGEIGNNSVEIIAEGIGDYVFALDEGIFQTENTFSVSSGIHTVFVKDLNGCGIVAEEFSIMDYPTFFTPNGDGINDYWALSGIEKNNTNIKTIRIFDRYGKLLATLNSFESWNGIYNGKRLPSNEYWFHIEFIDQKDFVGHFSLVR